MPKHLIAVLVLLTIALSACSGALVPNPSGGSDSNVLLQDDFSDSGSGWDQSSSTEGLTDYQNGGFRILVDIPSYSIWANPNQSSYTDVIVEVDAQKIAGPDDNEFGIICRHADPANFYAAVVSSDGFFGFWRRVDGGDLEMIGGDSMQTSDSINLGEAGNHLRLDCVGSTLTLYANGDQLASVSDSTHASGDVGLYAGTFDTAGTDVLFDNFVATQP